MSVYRAACCLIQTVILYISQCQGTELENDWLTNPKAGPPQRFPRGGGGLNQGSRFPAPPQFGAPGGGGPRFQGPRFNNPFGGGGNSNGDFRDGPDERFMNPEVQG